MTIESFTPEYSAAAWKDLRGRIQRTRWPDVVPDSDWDYGADTSFVRDICSYWAEEFDWESELARSRVVPHFKFSSAAGHIHFIHVRGKGPNPIPLILTHGWPGSYLEMLKLIPILSDPAAHGGVPEDSFDVVVPSLPGFGYSAKPGRGMNVFAVSDLWVELMAELGYERFAAQGGDIGAGVTTALGLRHAHRLLGIHLNFIPGSYRPHLAAGEAPSAEERTALEAMVQWADQHGAYAHVQRTTPLTAAYALNDSPVGLAAWILEKFYRWSDCKGDLLSRFTRDELLSNVTLYWMTQTIYSSFRIYFEGARAPLTLGAGERVAVPCAIARFPKEIFFSPRSWVERGYAVERWTEMPRGGHFAAWEEPGLLADDLRSFFRQFR
ncbi:epoxide hydrolase [Acidobacteria bacterium AB60]|nr:epoxide hydrolase [Acidobacteria bacterium AB60]